MFIKSFKQASICLIQLRFAQGAYKVMCTEFSRKVILLQGMSGLQNTQLSTNVQQWRPVFLICLLPLESSITCTQEVLDIMY